LFYKITDIFTLPAPIPERKHGENTKGNNTRVWVLNLLAIAKGEIYE
jgi:hypothetical protein